LYFENGNSEGTLIAGKYPFTKDDCFLRDIDILGGNPIKVKYSVSPTMIFFDVKGHIDNGRGNIGKCFEPTLREVLQTVVKLFPISYDPSKLNGWDQIRHRVHGKFHLTGTESKGKLINGVSTYDPSEHIEANCSRFDLNFNSEEWRIGLVVDDFKLAQNPTFLKISEIVDAPRFEFEFILYWLCNGKINNDYFFEIKLPKEFRTLESLLQHRNLIKYDSYENWRANELNIYFSFKLLEGNTKL
jgi:hypothetical protein